MGMTCSCPWESVFPSGRRGPHLPFWFLSSAGLLLLLLSGLQAGKSDSPRGRRPVPSPSVWGVGRGTTGCPCQRGPCHRPSCFSRNSCEVAGPQAWVMGGIESHTGVACLEPVAPVSSCVRCTWDALPPACFMLQSPAFQRSWEQGTGVHPAQSEAGESTATLPQPSKCWYGWESQSGHVTWACLGTV